MKHIIMMHYDKLWHPIFVTNDGKLATKYCAELNHYLEYYSKRDVVRSTFHDWLNGVAPDGYDFIDADSNQPTSFSIISIPNEMINLNKFIQFIHLNQLLEVE